MSAKQCFALCLDCWELGYGITDNNGVFSRDSGSSNHWDHAVHTFGTPNDYPPPIRNILACLQGGLPISDTRAEMFSLACAIHAIQPNNGVKVDGQAAQAADSYIAPKKAPKAPAVEAELDLFGGVA